eukprot:gene5487-5554_t
MDCTPAKLAAGDEPKMDKIFKENGGERMSQGDVRALGGQRGSDHCGKRAAAGRVLPSERAAFGGGRWAWAGALPKGRWVVKGALNARATSVRHRPRLNIDRDKGDTHD